MEEIVSSLSATITMKKALKNSLKYLVLIQKGFE